MADQVLVTRGEDGRLREMNPTEKEAFVPSDKFFRRLLPDEIDEFKAWAHKNFEVDKEASPLWHPVVREEWAMLQAKAEELRKEGYPGGKPATGISG